MLIQMVFSLEDLLEAYSRADLAEVQISLPVRGFVSYVGVSPVETFPTAGLCATVCFVKSCLSVSFEKL